MNVPQLNFARKWRSRNFDQIIGQEISVRILKNTLYLDYYFPVYLFAGQRGCGKTTTARIFAAALNCEQLPHFQKDPKNHTIPCLSCVSCKAMAGNKHPDFIEIDGASHTGVDNVRTIIDASALLPLLGRKKIYLIDEAHMLSKAAFNAFLKVLEEPPASVLFILATTELEKIIETVRSRSFQLFFKAVKPITLLEHIKHICMQEKIEYEEDGLALIVQETSGSVRDALNVLEQVRFATTTITKKSVTTILGHCDDETMVDFFSCILEGDSSKLLQCMQTHMFYTGDVEQVWRSLLAVSQATVWIGYGLVPLSFNQHHARLKNLVASYSLKRVNALLQVLYANELLFLKTKTQYTFFETILLNFCNAVAHTPSSAILTAPHVTALPVQSTPVVKKEEPRAVSRDQDTDQKWLLFLDAIEALNDPLLNSIFKQTEALSFDATAMVLKATFSQEFVFFNDWLENSEKTWKPLLRKIFGEQVIFQALFTGEKKNEIVAPPLPKPATLQRPPAAPSHFIKKEPVRMQRAQAGPTIDVSDKKVWQKASLITQFFPGIIQEYKESLS